MSELKNKENAKGAFSAVAIFMLLYLAYKRSKIDDELGLALRKIKRLLWAFMIWAFIVSAAFAGYNAFVGNSINLSFSSVVLFFPFLYILLKWLFGGQKGKYLFFFLFIVVFIRLIVILICGEPINNFFSFG